MRRLLNKEKISNIAFERTISPFCPLGNDYYTADIHAEFVPYKYYPDYIEVDKAIQELNGKSLTIEQLADKVYRILNDYGPDYISVEIYAESNKHFPVLVTKSTC